MPNPLRPAILLIVLLVSGTMATLPFAVAQSQDARWAARALTQKGAQYYEKGDFPAALEKFRQAYGQYPNPKLWFNIGQALRALSQNTDALAAFQRFLAEAKDASPEYQAQATAQEGSWSAS